MPKLLNRMPFLDQSTTIFVRGESVHLRSNQLILWLSLTLRRVDCPNPQAIPFPVILDTGFMHSFAIQERHLIAWGGLRPDVLATLGTTRDRGTRISLREANIWIHPNRRGTLEPKLDRIPHWLDAEHGIAIYPTGDFPRLPILGLRAIAENNLILHVNGRQREATLRTSASWWPF